MSSTGQTRIADFCSVRLETRQREDTDATPLEQYERRAYATGDGERAKALDAAVALTASTWGPAFDTHHDDGGEWWVPAYECAADAVETAIVDALVGGGEP